MGYFNRKVDRARARRLIRVLNDEAVEGRPWEAIPDQPLRTRCFIRFSTLDRHPLSARRRGIFSATYEARRDADLDPHVSSSLEAALEWFGDNLATPNLDEDRAVFLFKSDAIECMRRIWELALSLREAGIWIDMQTFNNPGRGVYEDEHQVAVVPWADEMSI